MQRDRLLFSSWQLISIEAYSDLAAQGLVELWPKGPEYATTLHRQVKDNLVKRFNKKRYNKTLTCIDVKRKIRSLPKRSVLEAVSCRALPVNIWGCLSWLSVIVFLVRDKSWRPKNSCLISLTVDGQWSQWSGFGSCSQTCGGGFKRRSRKCDNPSPASRGRNCPGASFQSLACNIHSCPGKSRC